MSSSEAASRRVYIETYGCQMNTYDSSAIGGILTRSGYALASDPAAADIILLNTCSVRELAEHKVFSRIGELRSLRRRGQIRADIIGVCGCMAERLSGALATGEGHADLVAGVDQYAQLPRMLARLLSGAARTPPLATGHLAEMHYVAPPAAYPANNSHLVTIHKGCDYRCTYCIVPATRGPQREKAPSAILDEIRGIVAAGGDEVTLLGQNVTAYRAPGLDFAGLLRQVAGIDGLARIRFLTGHPCDMDERLIGTIGSLDKVCPWLHLPAQSGSDRILRRMKRFYTRDQYLSLIETARRLVRDATFSGDFIVGFPGETDDDFRLTLELVREVRYDQTFNFKYSARPGTPAARLDDDVDIAVKKERLAEVMRLQDEIWQELAAQEIGHCRRAAVEGRARRPEGALKARTPNNRKVLLKDCNAAVGDVLDIRITGCEATTFFAELA
ncbi:tRNA (N6-isopentenyl adenosine(37)-C2)-methylthiotransferase MiaB [bacterium]|nr:tRNA (N6-isopentenyl adenosine(37)-C2)-methylthiotransferase MiaB [bacterium]MBU1073139.1 tRNA (N6-isopentenyl adenosine(37)-C2)-methylthiotransferase MiaB [bacterium]